MRVNRYCILSVILISSLLAPIAIALPKHFIYIKLRYYRMLQFTVFEIEIVIINLHFEFYAPAAVAPIWKFIHIFSDVISCHHFNIVPYLPVIRLRNRILIRPFRINLARSPNAWLTSQWTVCTFCNKSYGVHCRITVNCFSKMYKCITKRYLASRKDCDIREQILHSLCAHAVFRAVRFCSM